MVPAFYPTSTTRNSLEAHREVLKEKLKNHHKNLGTLGSKEAVQERRRVYVTLGLLSAQDHHLVTRVDEPLPRKKEVQAETSSQRPHCNDGAFSSDDDSLFIAPEPSSSKGLSALQPDDCAISDELLRTCTSRKRKHGPSQKGAKKVTNTILNYCTIQKWTRFIRKVDLSSQVITVSTQFTGRCKLRETDLVITFALLPAALYSQCFCLTVNKGKLLMITNICCSINCVFVHEAILISDCFLSFPSLVKLAAFSFQPFSLGSPLFFRLKIGNRHLSK